jgi:hypothetical protein
VGCRGAREIGNWGDEEMGRWGGGGIIFVNNSLGKTRKISCTGDDTVEKAIE